MTAPSMNGRDAFGNPRSTRCQTIAGPSLHVCRRLAQLFALTVLVPAGVGGIVVHLARFDFVWGPVPIRHEESFCSMVGAILTVAAGRSIRSRMKRKVSPQ